MNPKPVTETPETNAGEKLRKDDTTGAARPAKSRARRAGRWLAAVALTPVALFFVLAIIVYLPPVQQYLADKTCQRLSAETGLDIRIDHVRLAFPLDLAANGFSACEGRDTIVAARSLRLDVAFWPLFRGRADIEGFGLYNAVLGTKDWISDTRIEGRVGRLTAASHGIEWRRERIALDEVCLRDADLLVVLSDTAAADTSASDSRWDIRLARAELRNTRLKLALPGDSMFVRTAIGRATLNNGCFDTGKGNYTVGRLRLARCQLGADLCPQASASPEDAETFAPGLDPAHLRIDRFALTADSIVYRADGTLQLAASGIRLRERGGLEVTDLTGHIYMDSAELRVPALRLRTRHSRADIGLVLPWRALAAGRGGSLTFDIDAAIGHEDVASLAGGIVDAALLKLYPQETLTLRGRAGGNLDHLRIDSLEAALGGIARLTAAGHAERLIAPQRSGTLNFDASLGHTAALRPLLPEGLALPRGLRLKGTAGFRGERYEADLRLMAGGQARIKGYADLESETYSALVDARRFPVGAFLPGQGFGAATSRLEARGRGFDPTAHGARFTAKGHVSDFVFDKYQLGSLNFDAVLNNGKATATFAADNAVVRATGRLDAALDKEYSLTLAVDVDEVPVWQLAGMADTLAAGGHLRLAARSDRHFRRYGLAGGLENLRFLTPKKSISARDLLFDFSAREDSTSARINSGDLVLSLDAGQAPEDIGAAFGRTVGILMEQIDRRTLDYEALRQSLPSAALHLAAGKRNPLYSVLKYKGMSFESLRLDLVTNPDDGVSGHFTAGTFDTGSMQIDTIEARLTQTADGMRLHSEIRNYTKHNPNKFRAEADAFLLTDAVGAAIKFFDSDGRKGIDFGLRATLADSSLTATIEPANPVIAYRSFRVNPDNYFRLNRRGVSADIDLLADDGTGLKLYGAPADSTSDMTLALSHVNLGELSSVLPFMPRLSGMLSGRLRVTQDSRKRISADFALAADALTFEDAPLGNLGLKGSYTPEGEGLHQLAATLRSDSLEVLELSGIFHETDATFEGSAVLNDFPLTMANGFLAGTDVALAGAASGRLDISGPLEKPVFDGSLAFRQGRLHSPAYGFDLHMAETPVYVRHSAILLDNFSLRSAGSEPLTVSGDVNFSDLSRISLGLAMRARSYELINARRKRESLVYGKLLADFDGTLNGTLDHLVIRGRLGVLGGTDVTYILKDSPLSADDRLSSLVRFTDFNDSTRVYDETPLSQGTFDMTLGIDVAEAARFHCLLSEDGQSYVDVEGGGSLTLRMTETGDMRLTGRITMNSGEMKYELPVIPLKTFSLAQGSYIEFTGDAANPTLDIAATERVKATVTENEMPRSVNFDVGLHITQTLADMGLTFTIDAPEDLSVQNQLRAMTDAGRAKAAVAMLATGMYLTDESLASGSGGFKASNALNAFLQSEIQNIAGSALRTVDISLGVEDNTTAAGTTTTDYSFRFAKRFWNDRIAVVVGGKVSTGSEAVNSAETFIDNISVEYRLDRGSTRYVRAFYDRSATDPLEGQYTRTGAGLMLRRKTERLGELFLFRTRRKDTGAPASASSSGD